MSNLKVFATQASRTNMTHYIDPHDTHMDHKSKHKRPATHNHQQQKHRAANPKMDLSAVSRPSISCKLTSVSSNRTKQTRRAKAQTVHISHTGLLHGHLPYIINHHEHLSCFKQLYNKVTAQVLPFLWPCDFEYFIKVLKTGLKLYSIVVSSTIPSLKQISLKVSWQGTMFAVKYIS